MEIIKILAKDIVETCYECPLLVVGNKLMCIVTRKEIGESVDHQITERPKWCPLTTNVGASLHNDLVIHEIKGGKKKRIK